MRPRHANEKVERSVSDTPVGEAARGGAACVAVCVVLAVSDAANIELNDDPAAAVLPGTAFMPDVLAAAPFDFALELCFARAFGSDGNIDEFDMPAPGTTTDFEPSCPYSTKCTSEFQLIRECTCAWPIMIGAYFLFFRRRA